MKNNIENILIFFIFFIFVLLSYYQSINQSFGYITDQDWTIIYNSLLVISGLEQEYFDHPAYTTFLIYGLILKFVNFFFELNLNALEILDGENVGENLQNIFLILRVCNSIVIFFIYVLIQKTLEIFEISKFNSVLIILVFLFFDSIFQLLFLLRSEALSLLFFLLSNYYLLLCYKTNSFKKKLFFSSVFFTFSILTKTQTILLFLANPFFILFIKDKFNFKGKLEFRTNLEKKIIYIFGLIVFLSSLILYYKYPAPTDITFFAIYFIIYILFVYLIRDINYQKLKNILIFSLKFISGIFVSFLFIIFLDTIKLIPFDYSIIPNNFSRPISHMSSFTGLYDISNNNFLQILQKIYSELISFKKLNLILKKDFLYIFFIALFFGSLKAKISKQNIFFYTIIFINYIILLSIFLFFRDQYFYQIYFIPLFLLVLIELTNILPKKFFSIIVIIFIMLNFNSVKSRINEVLFKDMNAINLCGYKESDWNMINSKLKNYDKFQSLFCD